MLALLSLVSLYSDAEEDEAAVRLLETNLKPLVRSGVIEHVHRRGLQAGDRRARIDAAVREADVVLCVLSPDFLADPELVEQADAAAEDPRVQVMPLLWRPVDLPPRLAERMPVTEEPAIEDPDRAFLRLIRELRRLAPGADDDERGLRRRGAGEDLLSQVARVCQLREDKAGRKVRLRPRRGAGTFEQVLEVHYEDDFGPHTYIVAPLPRAPGEEDIQGLGELLRQRYLAVDALAFAELVYAAPELSPALLSEARRARIKPVTLTKYRGLIDFSGYLQRQTAALQQDPIYPPALYVQQRMGYTRGFGAQEILAPDHALPTLLRWTEDFDEPRFALVLGEFGTGKTFLLHQLALELAKTAVVVPILIRLRSLDRSHSLDALLSAHLANAGMERIDLAAFRYLLREGRIALLFDGFDELALRVGYDRAADHLATVAQAAQGKAKVVLTSRTQHFLSEAQVKTALARSLDALPGQHLVQLQPFDDGQIRAFLRNKLGAPALADARFALIDDVKDLLGLSHNPRMLSFIADLPEARLRAARARGEVTAAQLYRELLDF